ncbi:hypothetical protein D3C72_780900 [compost metagenome]
MPKIKVTVLDEAPPPFGAPAGRAVEIKPAEARSLVDAGLWKSPNDREGWTVAGPDGSVYAGRGELVVGSSYAKIRGKDGRRLGQGRWAKEEDEKRVPSSFSLLPAKRRALAHHAKVAGMTASQYVESLIPDLEEGADEAGEAAADD